jgi:hypothetical protein
VRGLRIPFRGDSARAYAPFDGVHQHHKVGRSTLVSATCTEGMAWIVKNGRRQSQGRRQRIADAKIHRYRCCRPD